MLGKGPYLRSASATITTERSPVKLDLPPVAKLGVAATTACALFEEDTEIVRCWGANVNGQVAVPIPPVNANTAFTPREVALPPGAPARDLHVGNATFVLRSDGAMVSWGANPPLARVSSLYPDPYPDVVPITGINGVAAAADNACALVGGVAHCWGSPIVMTIGVADALRERRLPEPVHTPEPLVQIATTRTVAAVQSTPPIPQRACAVSVSGAVYCWGMNASGQAGDRTTAYAYSPVRVEGLPGPAALVATTPKATCALLTSGEVHCWGDGFNGQLGRGKLGAPSLVPQEVILP